MLEFVDEKGLLEEAIAILETTGNLGLIGYTGSGKTLMMHVLAERLGVPLFTEQVCRDTDKWTLLGHDILVGGSTVFRPGIVVKWLESKRGGVLGLEEYNLGDPSVMGVLNSISDWRRSIYIPELDREFVRTEKHYIILTMNPETRSEYSGRFQVDVAQRRRYVWLWVDYLSPNAERRYLWELTGRNPKYRKVISRLVEWANRTRELYKIGELRLPVTTGNLKAAMKLIAEKGMNVDRVVEIISYMYPTEVERERVMSLWGRSEG